MFGATRAPEKRVGLQVKGGSFAVCVGPCLGEPGYVETRGESVRDGVKGIGLSQTDGGFGREWALTVNGVPRGRSQN